MTRQRAFNIRRTIRLSISDLGPRFGSTKRAAAATRGALILAVLSGLLLIAARPAQTQTETVLYNLFTSSDYGAYSYASLTPDGVGNFYGTTYSGGSCSGASQCQPPYPGGTVFELSPNAYGGWNETDLYSFCSAPNCTDGAGPISNVIFDSAGNLYGTTYFGGNGYGVEAGWGYGVVFELSPGATGWTETVLYSFCPLGGCTDGPLGLIFDRAGNLYVPFGTFSYNIGYGGSDTVFELSPAGSGWTEQVIYANGSSTGGLTMDAAGNIYGVTGSTAFELSPNGSGGWTPSVIYTFSSGGGPSSTPVLDSAGNLYGTIRGGGASCGTVYELSPGDNGWTEKSLYSFKNNGYDGCNPVGGVTLDAAGDIYGTTQFGGKNVVYIDGYDNPSSTGTVFELAAPVGTGSHKESVLWNFNGTDGLFPESSLILDSAGNLYGTTWEGGSSFGLGPDGGGFGVAFELSQVPHKIATTTTLVSSPNPSLVGQAATFTAAVSSTAGIPANGETVSFIEGKRLQGKVALSGGSASFTTSTLKVGTDSITAVYGGDSNFGGSTSTAVNQVVSKATTTTALASSQNPSIYKESVTFTATVTPQLSGTTPTGAVKFYNGAATLKTVTLSGGVASYTTTTLAAGTASITAQYEGSTSFDSSTSAAVSQVVNQANTTTTLVSSLNPSNSGQSVTFTATVVGQFGSKVTGSVTFLDGTTTLKTVGLSGGVAEYTTSKLTEGAHTITATYDGSTDFTTGSASLTQTVN